MKIKSVCELTGLTDRTIRYYIEEELISPSFTENYMGRKTYNFSEKDINDLKDIAVLRKFDFTLEEIKSVIYDAETSKEILINVKNRTAQAVSDGQSKFSVLSQISTDKAYTVAELAEELSKTSLVLPEHKETIRTNKWDLIGIVSNIIFSVLYVPMGGLFYFMGIMLFTLGYPEEPFTAVCSFIATLLLALTPVFCVLAILLSVRSRRKANFVASFLVQFLPFGTLGIAMVVFFLYTLYVM